MPKKVKFFIDIEERPLRFYGAVLSSNFVEEFNSDYQDVTELDFSFKKEDRKDVFSPIESDKLFYEYPYTNYKPTSSKLNFQDAEYVAQILKTNKGVKKISFKGQNIGDNGAYYILRALHDNPDNIVEELDFRDSGITENTLVLFLYFYNVNSEKTWLSHIGIDHSLINSPIIRILEKYFNNEELSGEEEWLVNIDSDVSNPFCYIRSRDAKYGFFGENVDNYQKIIFKNQHVHQEVENLFKTVDTRKDTFFILKLADYYLSLYDFSNRNNNQKSLKLKIKYLIEASKLYSLDLEPSKKVIVESQIGLFNELFPESKEKVSCCC